MKKYLVAALAVAFITAMAIPAGAASGGFQETYDWVASWTCDMCKNVPEKVKEQKDVKTAARTTTTDALGNTVPGGTDLSGKTTLGQ